MTWNKTRLRARKTLDQRLGALKPTDQYARPPRGWIRALRDALGLSAAQLGGLLGIRSQSVDDIEKSEVNDRITLETLSRVAAAMDCRLVYALVPNSSLEGMVRKRAEAIALAAIRRVSHTMALEDQQVPVNLEQLVDDYIAEHLSERDLWSSK